MNHNFAEIFEKCKETLNFLTVYVRTEESREYYGIKAKEKIT